jgi:hypothetical protein
VRMRNSLLSPQLTSYCFLFLVIFFLGGLLEHNLFALCNVCAGVNSQTHLTPPLPHTLHTPAHGKVVLALEGGYSLRATGPSLASLSACVLICP